MKIKQLALLFRALRSARKWAKAYEDFAKALKQGQDLDEATRKRHIDEMAALDELRCLLTGFKCGGYTGRSKDQRPTGKVYEINTGQPKQNVTALLERLGTKDEDGTITINAR